MDKKPIYITINDKQSFDHTTAYSKYLVDYDKKGRVIGIEILDYEKIELNGDIIKETEMTYD